jgi:hypothetical protein
VWPVENQESPKVIKGSILERIRQRPPMFLGKHSLSAFMQFMAGYSAAQYELGIERSHLIPVDFHDWVAYRLHFVESTSGYGNMILGRTSNEAEALTRFFELLDEHSTRQPLTVARIRCHPKEYKIEQQTKFPDGTLSEVFEALPAEEVSIVTFTDDPGFFLVNDDPSRDHPRGIAFCPSLSWLHRPYRPDPEFTTVFDQQQFDRLSREAASFENARRETGRYPNQIPKRDDDETRRIN